ncbi:sensor histidine kinase [Geothrix limicola]|uniref:sensor histidine kinase n=1 Tax=Geothrix limicola TaxID=2927978 RepID=UPI002557C221|nr:HAMP domain-containing sensor histidine kinase [Geothrix limicola]
MSDGLTALILQDGTGTWYRDSSGLSRDQLAALESTLTQEPGTDAEGPLEREGLQMVKTVSLVNGCHQVIGTFCVLSPVPLALSEAQLAGLALLAEHIQTIVKMDQQKLETRAAPRPPAAASFVPGLVHELGSFIFGISANLDAFEARFADLDEVKTYGANIRRSLDRMGAFIVELREYGYPQRLSWSPLEPEPMLREVFEHQRSLAEEKNIDLQIRIDGVLPALQGDREGLRTALARVVDLVLHKEEPGGRVVISVAPGRQGNREAIFGHLDFSFEPFMNIDPARLFEPFYYRVSGLGRLALPGARRVFESHGGTLTAGKGPDGSMRISFMLPSEVAYPLRSATQP